jgi:hypothetical protein
MMKSLRILGLAGLIIVTFGASALAFPKSANWGLPEAQFGPGALLNATSASYAAQQSLGSTGIGSSNSASYGALAGYLTANAPFLEMVVNASTISLGTLSTASTATGTGTFHVRAYTDSGYTVQTLNNPPTQEKGYSLSGIPAAAASAVGTEQFGINLVQNQTICATPAPANFGANPAWIPSGTFANGVAAAGYNTCGLFKYVKGDTIAQNNGKGWGETDYTISYIVNISSISRAGSYTMTQDLVAVPVY